MGVLIEPKSSAGPNVEGIKGTRMVGEIKHLTEPGRDLKSKFCGDWNSLKQHFGGKGIQGLLQIEWVKIGLKTPDSPLFVQFL